MSDQKTKVLILGGGFAGVYTGMHLGRALKRAGCRQVEVTLVSRENYIVFQPMLPDVISGALEILHVISPIRRLAKSAQVYTREIESIDLDRKTVRLSPGFRPKPLELSYDHLVIGLGSQLDPSRVPGMREHAIPFKYLGDALRLRHHLVRVLEEADIEADADERRRLLTFVVAGGGFSGVECLAELNDFVRRATKVYRNIRPDDCRFLLLQSGERILPELTENLAEFAHRILERRGVEIRLGARLAAVTADAAMVFDKAAGATTTIATRTTVATVPSGPHALLTKLPCELERGRIKVNPTLDVPGWPGVWAVGDCAAVPQPDGITSPPTAQHALRQAKTCAGNIVAEIRGGRKQAFTFTGLGKLGSLGRGSAVAEVFGLKFSGFFAWLMWRGVYLAKFPGFDRKVRVLVDWLLDLVLPRDVTQVRIFSPDSVEQEHFEAGEWVFDQGDFGDKVYFVVAGEAEVVRDGQPVATLAAGDVFGEIALVSDRPRTAAVRARGALDVIVVSRAAFEKLLAHVPGVQTTMNEIMSRHSSETIVGDEPPPA